MMEVVSVQYGSLKRKMLRKISCSTFNEFLVSFPRIEKELGTEIGPIPAHIDPSLYVAPAE